MTDDHDETGRTNQSTNDTNRTNGKNDRNEVLTAQNVGFDIHALASFAREEERSQPSYDLVAAPVGARAAGYLSEGFVDVHLINHTNSDCASLTARATASLSTRWPHRIAATLRKNSPR